MAMTGGTAKLVSQGTPPGWPGPVSLYVYYKEESQSIDANSTVLSLGMYITTPNGWDIGPWSDFHGSYIGTATSGNDCKTFNGALPANTQGTRWLVENQKVTVVHNADGTKKANIYWHWGVTSVWSGVMRNPSGSFSITLTTIPRASAISSASAATLGNKCSVKWTPAATSFRYKLNFAIGNWSYTTGVIHPNQTSEYTYTGYTIPLDVANQIPNGTTGTMKVTLGTYSDANATAQIGSSSSQTFTVTVPDNNDTKPAVSMTLEPVSSLSSTFAGLYLQGKTKVKANLSATGKYSATIKSYSMEVEGKSYGSGDSFTSDHLARYGKITVRGYATDSRGFTNSVPIEITVLPYSAPKINVISCGRCDANGNPSDSGTYLKINAKLTYEKVVVDGTQKNHGKIQFRYRADGAASYSDWQTILDTRNTTNTEVTTGALLNGTLSVKTNYQIQVRATDNIEVSNPVTMYTPSEEVYMDRPAGGKSMGLGGYSSGDGNLDVYWRTKARGGLSMYTESGEEMNMNKILALPRGQLGEGWDANNLPNGVHAFQSAYPLKNPAGTLLMYNGALIQMPATIDGSVIIQIALSIDTGRNPMYRLKWFSNWSDWTSFKV